MRSLLWLCLSLLLLGPAAALASPEAEVARLSSDRRFTTALKVLEAEHDRTVADIIRLTQKERTPSGPTSRPSG
jgi:hypothetical protein